MKQKAFFITLKGLSMNQIKQNFSGRSEAKAWGREDNISSDEINLSRPE